MKSERESTREHKLNQGFIPIHYMDWQLRMKQERNETNIKFFYGCIIHQAADSEILIRCPALSVLPNRHDNGHKQWMENMPAEKLINDSQSVTMVLMPHLY